MGKKRFTNREKLSFLILLFSLIAMAVVTTGFENRSLVVAIAFIGLGLMCILVLNATERSAQRANQSFSKLNELANKSVSLAEELSKTVIRERQPTTSDSTAGEIASNELVSVVNESALQSMFGKVSGFIDEMDEVTHRPERMSLAQFCSISRVSRWIKAGQIIASEPLLEDLEPLAVETLAWGKTSHDNVVTTKRKILVVTAEEMQERMPEFMSQSELQSCAIVVLGAEDSLSFAAPKGFVEMMPPVGLIYAVRFFYPSKLVVESRLREINGKK